MKFPWLYVANTPVVNVSRRLPTLPMLKATPLCPCPLVESVLAWCLCIVFYQSVSDALRVTISLSPQSPGSWLAGWEGMNRQLVPSLCTQPGDTPSLLPQTLLSSGTWTLSRGKESWTSASLWGYRRSAMVACALSPDVGHGIQRGRRVMIRCIFSPGRGVGFNCCLQLWSEHWNFSFKLL